MTEEYFFVHGGLVPNVDIEKQDLYSTLMIRDEFIYHPVTIKQKVVFGHTPFEKPLVQVDKIGIDTGSGKFEKSYITALICGSEDFVFSM